MPCRVLSNIPGLESLGATAPTSHDSEIPLDISKCPHGAAELTLVENP